MLSQGSQHTGTCVAVRRQGTVRKSRTPMHVCMSTLTSIGETREGGAARPRKKQDTRSNWPRALQGVGEAPMIFGPTALGMRWMDGKLVGV